MIKNIIFDMGGVLIDYNPEKTLYGLFDKETADILLREIFRNQLWSDKDRGIITPEEIMLKKRNSIPEGFLKKSAKWWIISIRICLRFLRWCLSSKR